MDKEHSGAEHVGPSKYAREDDAPAKQAANFTVQMAVVDDQNSRHRREMEDTHYIERDFLPSVHIAAVFDGHGGKDASKWCRLCFALGLQKQLLKSDTEEWDSAIDRAFVSADRCIVEHAKISSGCTAAVCMIDCENRRLFAANCGDARIVLLRGDRAIRLSYDHKGSDKIEQERVAKCGGIISHNRVSGILAITRSLGDADLKKSVTGRPYTVSLDLTDEDKMVIVASDGLWDALGDQQACDHVIRVLGNIFEHDPQGDRACLAASTLLRQALRGCSCDNVTVAVCLFNQFATFPSGY